MSTQDNQMSCGCSFEECGNWLQSVGARRVNGTSGEPEEKVCCKCSLEGPFSELNESLKVFRQEIIGDLDITKDQDEIARRFAAYMLERTDFFAHSVDELLDAQGKALLAEAEKGGAREMYRYADYLSCAKNSDNMADKIEDEEEWTSCTVHWLARAAVAGDKRALRDMGWLAGGGYDGAEGWFSDDYAELPHDDIVSDCCFWAAAAKGDLKAIDLVAMKLIHPPREGNEDYVLALEMMGPFANVDDTGEPGRTQWEERLDRRSIMNLHGYLDEGLKESSETASPQDWLPWEHPYAVAICAENGWRMEKDVTKALQYYREAAQHGCKAAQSAVERLERGTDESGLWQRHA
jgi:TPR repeat protein